MLKNLKTFFLENRTPKQTIAKNTFWLFFGQIFNRLIKAVLVIYAARILGAQGYGVFSFALSFAMMVLIFSDMGIGPLLVRETAKIQDEKTRKKHISTSFYLKVFLMILCSSLMLVGTYVLPNKESAALLWILIFFVIFTLFKEFFLALARALEKMEIEALANVFEISLAVILGLYFLNIAPVPQGLAWAYVLGALACFLFLLVIFRRSLAAIFGNFEIALVWQILKWGWPFAAGALIGSILTYTDILMLGWLKPIETVGWYAAALKIPLLLIIPAGIIHNAILPTLSRLGDSREKFHKLINCSTELLLALALPAIGGGLVLAAPIINLIFGQQYLASIPAFKIALFLIPINYLWSVIGAVLFVKNLQKNNMVFAAGAAGLNIILNLVLIPPYGLVGAALASVFSQVVGFFWALNLFKKITEAPPFDFKELEKLLLAALAMILFLLIPGVRNAALWINIPIAGLIYFSFLCLLKTALFREGAALYKNYLSLTSNVKFPH